MIKPQLSTLLIFLCLSFASKAQNRLPNSGKVGLGTNNPKALLDVNGKAILRDTVDIQGHLFVLLLTSCSKLNYKDATLQVYVENVSLHEPLEGHPVILKEIASSLSSTSVSVIDRKLSDVEGMVYFDFEAHKNRDYQIEFDYQGGIDGFVTLSLDRNDPNGTMDRVDISPGVDQFVELRIVRGGTLLLTIQNWSQNFIDETMHVDFEHQNGIRTRTLTNKEERFASIDLWEGKYNVRYFIATSTDTSVYFYETLDLSVDKWPSLSDSA